MSGSVKLKLPLGGSKTISAPDSASDETITLPAGTKTLATVENFTSTGIDDNATSTTMTIAANSRVDFWAASNQYAIQLKYNSATSGCYLGSPSANAFALSTAAGTERLRIDSSGNVGVGVVPESWHSSQTALQVGGTGAISGTTSQAAGSDVRFANNAYINGSDVDTYTVTDEVSMYRMTGGNHIWYTAPSGTADTAISWTNAMTIDNSGRVTMPYQPYFKGSLASALSPNVYVPHPGNIVPVVNSVNQGNCWNSSTNKFTAPVTGVYQVTVTGIKYPVNGPAHIDLYRNNSDLGSEYRIRPQETATYNQFGGTLLVTLSVNDTLHWQYFGDSGIYQHHGQWIIRLVQ